MYNVLNPESGMGKVMKLLFATDRAAVFCQPDHAAAAALSSTIAEALENGGQAWLSSI